MSGFSQGLQGCGQHGQAHGLLLSLSNLLEKYRNLQKYGNFSLSPLFCLKIINSIQMYIFSVLLNFCEIPP